MREEYQLYAMMNGKKTLLLAIFYDLKTAKEIINTSITSYELELFMDNEMIYSITRDY